MLDPFQLSLSSFPPIWFTPFYPLLNLNRERIKEKPNKLTVKEQVNTITNTNVNNNPDTENEKMYSYCRVRVGAPWKPLLYYFTGGLKIDIGDHVIVPLGEDNTETEAFVVGIGERIAKGFPCPFEKIKTVIRVIK